jgi:hypothetical protein
MCVSTEPKENIRFVYAGMIRGKKEKNQIYRAFLESFRGV